MIMLRWALLTVLLSGSLSAPNDDRAGNSALEDLRRRLANPQLSVEQRTALLEAIVNRFDRRALEATSVEDQQQRWLQAVELIDWYVARHPEDPSTSPFRIRSAIFRWATVAAWEPLSEILNDDNPRRVIALRRLDQALETLEPLRDDSSVVGDLRRDLRYRLAQILWTRTRWSPHTTDPASLIAAWERGLAQLDGLEPNDEGSDADSMAISVRLLRASFLAELGHVEEARTTLEAIDPSNDLLEDRQRADWIRVSLRIGDVGTARDALADWPDLASRKLWELRCALTDWNLASDDPKEKDRSTKELIRLTRTMTQQPGASVASGFLAAAGWTPESDEATVEDWEYLVAGYQLRNEPKNVRDAYEAARRIAERQGDSSRVIALTVRLAAVLYQMGQPADSLTTLDQLDGLDPDGTARTPQISLLRILNLQALEEAGDPRIRDRLEQALQDHITRFPDSPTSDQTRYLLGNLLESAGRSEEARQTWSEISDRSPRWFDAQQAILDSWEATWILRRSRGQDIEADAAYQETFTHLERSLARIGDDDPTGQLDLKVRSVRLNLISERSNPDQARRISEQLLAGAAPPQIRRRIQSNLIHALTQLSRFREADRVYTLLRNGLTVEESLTLIDRLSRSGSASPVDSIRRDYASLIARILDDVDASKLSPVQQAFLTLKQSQTAIEQSNFDRAEEVLDRQPITLSLLDTYQLEEFGNDLITLSRNAQAAATFESMSQRLEPGRLDWFRARYGWAYALIRDGRVREAKALLDSALVLYPDVLEGEWKQKYRDLQLRVRN